MIDHTIGGRFGWDVRGREMIVLGEAEIRESALSFLHSPTLASIHARKTITLTKAPLCESVSPRPRPTPVLFTSKTMGIPICLSCLRSAGSRSRAPWWLGDLVLGMQRVGTLFHSAAILLRLCFLSTSLKTQPVQYRGGSGWHNCTHLTR